MTTQKSVGRPGTPVAMVDTDHLYTRTVFPSVRDASTFTNIDAGNISGACSGTRKTAGGYAWEYVKDESKPEGLKFDTGKLQYSLIPPSATKALAEVLSFGAKKYEKHSWKTVPDGEERYLNALYRHLEAVRQGEEYDPESGFSHYAHVLCNAAFLLEFQQTRLKV